MHQPETSGLFGEKYVRSSLHASASQRRSDFVAFNGFFSGTGDSKQCLRMLKMIPRCGRPSTSITETNVELVKKIVGEDQRLTVRLISNDRGLSRNRVWHIITADLRMRKVCGKIAPKLLE